MKDAMATHLEKRHGKGSTGFRTAVPTQQSDGGSEGMPRISNTPSLRKPVVLATMLPEPSQGTPGTAIGAELYHLGPALPYGAINRFMHDRRFALFRRRAVDKTFRLLAYNHICSHSSVWETAASSADDRLTKTYFKLKTVSISV